MPGRAPKFGSRGASGSVEKFDSTIDAANVLCYAFSTQQAPVPLPVRGFLTGVESATAVQFPANTDGLSVCAIRLEEHPTERNATDNLKLSECSEVAPHDSRAPLYLLVMPVGECFPARAGFSCGGDPNFR